MSVAELKCAVDGLSPDERLELADYLSRRAKQDDPQWEAELGKRLDRCLEGKGHPPRNCSPSMSGFHPRTGEAVL